MKRNAILAAFTGLLLTSGNLPGQCWTSTACTSSSCLKVANGNFSFFGYGVTQDYTPYDNAGLGSDISCWNASHGGPSMTPPLNGNEYNCALWWQDVAMKAYGGNTFPAGYGDGVYQDMAIHGGWMYFGGYDYRVTNQPPGVYTYYTPQLVSSFGTLDHFYFKFANKSAAFSTAINIAEPIVVPLSEQTADYMTGLAPAGSYASRTFCAKADNDYDAIWFYPRQDQGTYNSRISLDNIFLYEADAGLDRVVDCGVPATVLGQGCATIPGAVYSWSPSLGLSATNVLSPTVALAQVPGIMTYTLSITWNGCTLTDEVTIVKTGGNWSVSTFNSKGDVGNDVLTDSQGNIYVAGSFDESVYLNPGSCPVLVSRTGIGKTAYLAKYAACGDLVWVNYESASGWSEGAGIAIDELNNAIYMTGNSSGNVRFLSTPAVPCGGATVVATVVTGDGYYIAKFDLNTGMQEALMETPAPASPVSAYNISAITVGRVNTDTTELFICGSHYNSSTTARHAYLARYNWYGSTINSAWQRSSLTPAAGTNAHAYDIAYNAAENLVYITGEFQNLLKFSTTLMGSVSVSNTVATKDAFIAAFGTKLGFAIPANLRKADALSGKYASGRSLTVDENGTMYYTGDYSGGFSSSNPLFGFSGAYLSSYIQAAYVIPVAANAYGGWRQSVKTSNPGGYAYARGIAVNSSEVVLTGIFNTYNMFFGTSPTTYGYYVSGTAGLSKIYLLSLDRSSGMPQWGNVTQGTPVNSEHLSTSVAANNYFSFTTGQYVGTMEYQAGVPPVGPMTSSYTGNKNTFIIRNDLAGSGEFLRTAGDEAHTISIDQAQAASFKAYPNPTDGMLTLDLSGFTSANGPLLAEVFDLSGRLVTSAQLAATTTLHQIDLSGLEKGIYLLRISNSITAETQRIVVE